LFCLCLASCCPLGLCCRFSCGRTLSFGPEWKEYGTHL
jgi:hypothetical protein